jgi:putative phosphoesterase
MKRIGLISDTHGYTKDDLFESLEDVDEVWHAGDIGSEEVLDKLVERWKTRAVFGNIDNRMLQLRCEEDLSFEIEGVSVFMTHIGGYPGRYRARVRDILIEKQPMLYVCGHSHILKVMPDRDLGLLHMNPGSCGNHGIHYIRTYLRFNVEKGKIKDLEAVELGRRGY